MELSFFYFGHLIIQLTVKGKILYPLRYYFIDKMLSFRFGDAAELFMAFP